MFVQLADKSVPYKVFVDDVAARLAYFIGIDRSDPEYISQNKAYKLFGRSNVERWRKQGKIKPIKRPNRIDYHTADLRLLQRTQQDYLEV